MVKRTILIISLVLTLFLLPTGCTPEKLSGKTHVIETTPYTFDTIQINDSLNLGPKYASLALQTKEPWDINVMGQLPLSRYGGEELATQPLSPEEIALFNLTAFNQSEIDQSIKTLSGNRVFWYIEGVQLSPQTNLKHISFSFNNSIIRGGYAFPAKDSKPMILILLDLAANTDAYGGGRNLLDSHDYIVIKHMEVETKRVNPEISSSSNSTGILSDEANSTSLD